MSLFFPGGTRFGRREGRNRCLWREESFLMHLLQSTVNAPLGLRACIERWDQISFELRESPRERGLQIEEIERFGTILS